MFLTAFYLQLATAGLCEVLGQHGAALSVVADWCAVAGCKAFTRPVAPQQVTTGFKNSAVVEGFAGNTLEAE